MVAMDNHLPPVVSLYTIAHVFWDSVFSGHPVRDYVLTSLKETR